MDHQPGIGSRFTDVPAFKDAVQEYDPVECERRLVLHLPAITRHTTNFSMVSAKHAFFLTFNSQNLEYMLIERTTNNQIVITVSSSVDSFGLQRLIDYVKYLEATSKSKVKQSDIDKLADEVNASWWKKNRKRFIK